MLLSNEFINQYKDIKPPFGGNGFGEIVYLRCVDISTPILCSDLNWRDAGNLNEGDEIIAFDEFSDGKNRRKIKTATITHHHIDHAKCLQINLQDGTKLIATPEHQWLVKRGSYDVLQWVQTQDLINDKLEVYFPLFEKPWKQDLSYEAGFLSAAFDSEGSLDRVVGLSFVQLENPLLEKVKEYLTLKNFKFSIREKKNHENSFGFLSNKKAYQISIYGRENVLRFLGTFRPPRLLKKFQENLLKYPTGLNGLKAKEWIKLESIDDVGNNSIAVISTSTKTHFTGGFPSHNTYSRWLPEKGRREEWYETVRRVVEYSMSLHLNPYNVKQDLREEAENLFDNIFNLRVFPAGRTLWIGGTEAVKKYPMANFNCSFRVIDGLEAFTEIFYLLMLGCGTGFRVLPKDVKKIAPLRNNFKLIHTFDRPNNVNSNPDETEWNTISYNTFRIIVGDSKEGWVDALGQYFEILSLAKDHYNTIEINYSKVRPAGSLLKTFGGRASGPDGLREMFDNIHKVIQNVPENKNGFVKLRPIDALDVCNIIAYNVVVGGVRRSSQIALFDITDKEILDAKLDLYTPGSKNYGKNWRAMSNNSVFFTRKPTYEQLLDIFQRISHNGEPGFVNAVAANARRNGFQGINPCAEILLDNKGVCNLTEVNLKSFVLPKNENSMGRFDQYKLFQAIKHAVRMGLRQTNVTLELPEWDKVQKRDRLTGVSLTGVEDAFDLVDFTSDQRDEFLLKLNQIARDYAKLYAKEMRIPEPLLVTTVKPSGTISQLPTVSSGAHRSFAPYYIRRMRITASDPLARIIQMANYPIFPETGQGPLRAEFDKLDWEEQNTILQSANTWVAEFPIKTDANRPASQDTAVAQFYNYLKFQKYWTDHNTSISIYFKKEEIDDLIYYIIEFWDKYIAVSFLPTDTNNYNLMPYEQIDETEYQIRLRNIVNLNIKEMLNDLEKSELLDVELDPSCATGICPVR